MINITVFPTILLTEIFDDNNIYELTDDRYDEYYDTEQSYPYWQYSYNIDGSIRQINICHLSNRQIKHLLNELRGEVSKIVFGRTGIKYECDSFIEDDNKFIIVRIK